MIKINISTPPIIAKTLAVSGFAASVLLAATPAHAISFNFQFQDTAITNGLVKGTVSGLVEGINPGPGITATVTSSPGGGGVASNYSFYNFNYGNGAPAFIVTGGNITFAGVGFVNPDNNKLLLGTPGAAYYNQLNNSTYTFYYGDTGNTTTFTAATPVPFEYSPIALPASLAVCFGAAKLLKNHRAKKRMVSVEA